MAGKKLWIGRGTWSAGCLAMALADLFPANQPLHTRMNSSVSQEATLLSSPSHPEPQDAAERRSQAAFKSEWHDAKEIVVPFDDSGFSGLLVSEKEFAAAYAPKRARPPSEGLRLDTGRTVGRIVTAPGLVERTGSLLAGLLGVVEKVLMLWTPALMMAALPLPGAWAMSLAAGWIAVMWCLYRFGSGAAVSGWVWVSGVLVTLGWVYQVPIMR